MRLEDPLDVALGFAEAWNDHDPDALADLFVEDADFVNVVGLWWEDRKNIRRAHARGFRVMFGDSAMELRRTKVRELGDVAVVQAIWRMHGQVDPEGRGVGAREGVITFVVARREPEGWRAFAAQNTDRFEDAETLVTDGGSIVPTSYVPKGR